ncbi:hypothetical protein A2210_00910 [Candidatus Woesebacteria bacterium RIFOXYA1_FULL_40_18]|uniref:Mannosyl transferase n=4 Tax=Candidatus Woeseibacteriota TaxID=1752722 RepID=A0A0G0VL19_9BACT|nr:MAG: Mannosyl transferase [Candidatus Woesebacteria bacterium GW2011_GWA1_40_45]OGM76974.1 MAG: hypothetical protein A2210_00910 [Candidatus Woesebacteria bacterium RIFOXYA1_FULL_40_18]OGM81477.1 MAG: hypothetical protein A2361_02305 [Candidatus Woesebacteria bacterium RIFOXYB1_FULL_40_26]OGM86975.1 MAG: hypothetical protein A2614_01690 [Candidatus Woesebacteria bacterium RIFOXYD1_FULL_40_21]
MKVALVHDYIKEYGGAERVLRVLTDLFPKAPIYTAFFVKDSVACKEFSDRKIIESKWGWLIKYWNLYSPLRFLLPSIWRSIDLSEYDLVVTSCSGYLARGFKKGAKTKVIAYCHTPPKFLYGYQTSIDWQKYWPIRVYGTIINHFIRIFDFESAEEVDFWIANSDNVKERIKKFYRKDAEVVYPPIDVKEIFAASENVTKEDYFFIASRLVGGKGLKEAAEAISKLGLRLKIAGEAAGYAKVKKELESIKDNRIELLGRVSDKELYSLYAKARGFIALEKDVDFGMTPVEAMAAGTPTIALDSGGYKETVVDGETGILIKDREKETIRKAIERFNRIKWDKKRLQDNAKKFSKERFKTEMRRFVEERIYADK